LAKNPRKHRAGGFDTVGNIAATDKPRGGCPSDKAVRWEKMWSFPLSDSTERYSSTEARELRGKRTLLKTQDRFIP